MVIPLPSPATPHGGICRATRRDGARLAQHGVARRSFGMTKLLSSFLVLRQTGLRRGLRQNVNRPWALGGADDIQARNWPSLAEGDSHGSSPRPTGFSCHDLDDTPRGSVRAPRFPAPAATASRHTGAMRHSPAAPVRASRQPIVFSCPRRAGCRALLPAASVGADPSSALELRPRWRPQTPLSARTVSHCLQRLENLADLFGTAAALKSPPR